MGISSKFHNGNLVLEARLSVPRFHFKIPTSPPIMGVTEGLKTRGGGQGKETKVGDFNALPGKYSLFLSQWDKLYKNKILFSLEPPLF